MQLRKLQNEYPCKIRTELTLSLSHPSPSTSPSPSSQIALRWLTLPPTQHGGFCTVNMLCVIHCRQCMNACCSMLHYVTTYVQIWCIILYYICATSYYFSILIYIDITCEKHFSQKPKPMHFVGHMFGTVQFVAKMQHRNTTNIPKASKAQTLKDLKGSCADPGSGLAFLLLSGTVS